MGEAVDGTSRRVPDHLAIGVPALDAAPSGGLFHGRFPLVTGHPGGGRVTRGNRIADDQDRTDGVAVQGHVLAETHGRLLVQRAGAAPEPVPRRVGTPLVTESCASAGAEFDEPPPFGAATGDDANPFRSPTGKGGRAIGPAPGEGGRRS